MPKSTTIRVLLPIIVSLLVLTGCNKANPVDQAPAAVEAYLQALVAKDANQMINLSCAAWEAGAKQELNSFAAVKLTLEDLNCQEAGKSADFILVSCNGTLTASYGAEDLEINIAERTFQVVKEGDEWRMCGYKGGQ